MTKTSKAVFTIVALLVLVIITIVASIALYSWLTIHSSPYQIQFFDIRKIKVDAHKLEGDLLTLYIRNTGNTTATIDTIYLISPDGRVYVLEPAIINLKPRELKIITISIRDVPSGHYIVKIVMKDGSEYQYSMTIP